MNLLSLSGFDSVKTRLLLSSVTSSQMRHVLQCSLHFAIVNSNYWNIILKPKKVKCLVAIHSVYSGRDSVGILPTGYWKSIIFHLYRAFSLDKFNSRSTSSSSLSLPVVVVVSPLNSLISDQIRRSTEGKIKATVFKVRKTTNRANLELEYSETNPTLLKDVRLVRYMYDLMFTHPESVSCCKKGLELFQSSPYQQSIQAVVVDEAHCILER